MSFLQKLAEAIKQEAKNDISYRFMEFCGGHTYALAKYAIPDILPENIKMTHGPGCPVCVLPSGKIREVINLLRENKNLILCTYGDVLRVPDDTGDSLFKQKARGADVRIVYSCQDALHLAADNPNRQVVFFAVGFETTAPLTAAAIIEARTKGLQNFFVFLCHLQTPVAMRAILESSHNLSGVIAPGHVLAVTGYDLFKDMPERYKMPMVVSGFEAEDFDCEMWEVSVRNQIGVEFGIEDIPNICSLVEKTLQRSAGDLAVFRDANIYNFGKAGPVAAEQICGVLKEVEG